MSTYAGSDWIKSAFKIEMSPLGEEVADLLGDVFLGIYHLDIGQLSKTNWDNDTWIDFALGWHQLSTFDGNELTRLVILCHDRMIRCSIGAKNFHHIGLMFHKRKGREGSINERHPTIEDAIKQIRGYYE